MQLETLPWSLRALRQIPLPRKLGLLEYLYGRKLAAMGKCWVTTAAGLVWKLDLADVCHRWIVYGDYEGSTQMGWLRDWLAVGGVVVDSGANIGEMAQYLAVLPGVRLLCVEPVPESRAWLEECLVANEITSVDTVNVALGAAKGELELQIADGRSTLNTAWYANAGNARRRVEIDTIDCILDDHGIDRIRLWKLDVEGWEIDALKGARRRLEERAIDAILVEVVPQRFEDIRQWLAGHNYVIHKITASGLVQISNCAFFGNVVALPA